MSGPALWLRSLGFNVGWYLGSAAIAIGGAPLLLAPRRWVVAWARLWVRFVLWWLRITCGLTHRVVGRENLPAEPVIVALAGASAGARPRTASSSSTTSVLSLRDDSNMAIRRAYGTHGSPSAP